MNFQIHLWIGLILIVYLIMISVTGSILVFREELEGLKVPGAATATMETEWRDLDIDSLELVELVTALEDRFDVKIADGELKSIAGVGDAVRITLALANEPASA